MVTTFRKILLAFFSRLNFPHSGEHLSHFIIYFPIFHSVALFPLLFRLARGGEIFVGLSYDGKLWTIEPFQIMLTDNNAVDNCAEEKTS